MKEQQFDGRAFNMLVTVVNHFSKDPIELRSAPNFGTCLYNPPETKPKSIGCAVGMFLSTRVAKKLDSLSYGSIDDIIDEPCIPKWLKEMDIEFLVSIQVLHDKDYFWGKSGLSESGKEEVERITNIYIISHWIFSNDN